MVIFPIISLTIIALMTRYMTKTWFSPGAFFSLCWSFFLIVPIIFASDYDTDYLGIWFITIFSMSLATGSIVAYSSKIINKSSLLGNSLNLKSLHYFLAFFSLIIFVGLYMLFQYASKTYISSNYINDWMMIPNMISIDRYSGTLNYPIFIKYSLYFIYPGNLLGGLLFGLNKKSIKWKIFSMVPLFSATLLGVIEGARTSILLGLVLFFSAWLSTSILNQGKTKNRKRSYFKFTFGIGAILGFFTISFIAIQWLRQGMDTIIVDLLIERIRAYFFGYLSAFSQWLSIDSLENFNLGLITFAGPFNLIGVMERPLGFYDPIFIYNGTSTNIFTAFRGLISDFSISGSILIAFIIGFISQIIFQKSKNLLSTLPISMFYAFTIYSPLISIFHYNSVLFSWLIISIILLITKYEFVDSYS